MLHGCGGRRKAATVRLRACIAPFMCTIWMDLTLILLLVSSAGAFHIGLSWGIDSCQYICSVKDDVTMGVWERITAHASDAADLESLGGYTNHSFEHLSNWAPHFCARRQVQPTPVEGAPICLVLSKTGPIKKNLFGSGDYIRAHESFLWR